MTVQAPDTTFNELFWPLLPNFTSMEFNDALFSDMGSGPTPALQLATPESESLATPAAQTDAPQTQVDDESGDLESVLLQPVNSKAHDCFREAYNILGSFSFHCLNNAQSVSEEPPPGSASAPASTANRVPLDHVLRLNRDASEQLSRLLTCSCAGFPQLAMLYASIISQILVGYQQAAGCTQSAPWNSGDARLDPVSAPQRQSLTAFSPSASGVWPSTWSSTAASVLSAGGAKNTPTPTQPSEAVAPAKMVIGTFDIDDLRVQTALKIQLLTGEMRRAGQLIDQFALHTVDGQCMSDEYAFGGVHSLYQSLDAWLRSEHSRITNMMKAKLREFNS
ncbi:MAG: hypothetical protein L6R39_000414 [Caloplaca ligustica]|nr:MAG: hypothetical protein L6R39_000414 [Caloplaca ligustica]